ncbi:MAG: hypothetical protein ACAH10_14555 [Methylophilaceae bacterium]
MINEEEYEQKFTSLIQAPHNARQQYDETPTEEREQKLANWQNLKDEFNQLTKLHRQSVLDQKYPQ